MNIESSMVIVGIIGTAGRDKSQNYTVDLFNKMVSVCKYMLANLQEITLVSGGAAWADHVAVRLYLDGYVSKLILHLPCNWDNGKYYDNGSSDWRTNPGKMANNYHQKFSQILCTNSLEEINRAIEKGAEVHIHRGFHARNTLVAKCDYLIALTWSDTDTPAAGGTLDTWNKCKAQKYHISLSKI